MPARLRIIFQHSFIRVAEATFSTCGYSDIPERDVDTVIHLALTSGSGIWQSTEDKPWSSSTASQPRRRWAGPAGWSPVIASSSSSSRPSCSASSFSPIYRPQRSRVNQRSVGRWCLPLFDILSATEGVCPALLCPHTGLAATAAGSPKPASQPQRERPGC